MSKGLTMRSPQTRGPHASHWRPDGEEGGLGRTHRGGGHAATRSWKSQEGATPTPRRPGGTLTCSWDFSLQD